MRCNHIEGQNKAKKKEQQQKKQNNKKPKKTKKTKNQKKQKNKIIAHRNWFCIDVKVTTAKLGNSFRPEQLFKSLFDPEVMKAGARMSKNMPGGSGMHSALVSCALVRCLQRKIC